MLNNELKLIVILREKFSGGVDTMPAGNEALINTSFCLCSFVQYPNKETSAIIHIVDMVVMVFRNAIQYRSLSMFGEGEGG